MCGWVFLFFQSNFMTSFQFCKKFLKPHMTHKLRKQIPDFILSGFPYPPTPRPISPKKLPKSQVICLSSIMTPLSKKAIPCHFDHLYLWSILSKLPKQNQFDHNGLSTMSNIFDLQPPLPFSLDSGSFPLSLRPVPTYFDEYFFTIITVFEIFLMIIEKSH